VVTVGPGTATAGTNLKELFNARAFALESKIWRKTSSFESLAVSAFRVKL
jgi:hypothetical protein